MTNTLKDHRRRLVLANRSLARKRWPGEVCLSQLRYLERLTVTHGLSLESGDLQLLENRWYVTHSGLVGLANRKGCLGIKVELIRTCSDPVLSRWVFRATVFKERGSVGFVGYGDADPSNTSSLVRGAEMRVAETRAVNRALRKAYGIGLCSLEELGPQPSSVEPPNNKHTVPPNGSGRLRLRDKLCLLIRKYELDPNLVKRYAADFCGTETLHDASRDLIEAFVATIAEEAANNRAALVCKLNSYNQPEEVRP